MRFSRIFGSLLLLLTITGCQTTYYDALEKVGIPKRELMIKRIESTQEAQQDVQEQFQSALDQFQSIVVFNGGNLEELYKKLNREYEDSVSAADKVNSRIQSIQHVSEALFDEWQDELNLYSSTSLRSASARKLNETKRQYQRMITSMEKSAERMQPVLDVFQDQVLFLKHNLNAQAISSLKGEFAGVKREIDQLITQMERSIAESQRFVEQLRKTDSGNS